MEAAECMTLQNLTSFIIFIYLTNDEKNNVL